MTSVCRYCAAELTETVIDLGLSPISNEFRVSTSASFAPQVYYPLTVMVCTECWLVQLSTVETPQHFNEEYAYFSSYSLSWLDHAKRYVETMINRLSLGPESRVIEIGSNDGYLLQYFKKSGIPVLGIEPSSNVAGVARQNHGIDSVIEFFSEALAGQLIASDTAADLIVANNVLAHVPDINDFVAGLKRLLKPNGVITFEFPHLLHLVEQCQFDTIYHEHYSYLSLQVVERVLGAHGLRVFGAEKLNTHGGSLRVFACHQDSNQTEPELLRQRNAIIRDEADFGLEIVSTYVEFRRQVVKRKTEFLSFLINALAEGKTVLGYGAPAKGNTFLNYCGVGPELLAYTVDLNPYKQGKYLPGVNIPVRAPADLKRDRPNYVVILPWNLDAEISEQLSEISTWGGQFVTAIPQLKIFP